MKHFRFILLYIQLQYNQKINLVRGTMEYPPHEKSLAKILVGYYLEYANSVTMPDIKKIDINRTEH